MDTTQFVEAVIENSPIADESLVLNSTESKVDAYTGDDIAKAREQEKQKLYPQMDRLKEEIASLKRDKEEREAEEMRVRAEAEAEAKRRAEEDMDVRELLKTKEQEWSERLEQERLERERAIALLDQERLFAEMQAYRTQRIEAERENIMPELIDLIDGNNADEIEASIASLKDRSARILDSAQQAMTSARRDMVGTRTTVPASGPLDTDSERQFSPDDIKNMSLSDYQKYRERLLGSSQGRGRGLFG